MDINTSKILITDDSILARKQLKDIILTIGNPTFIEAVDGADCVEKYKEYSPDIVFLDIVMPKKDGNTAIKEIMDINPNALIIICSSIGTKSQLKAALESGATEFIQKPINKEQVVETITKVIKGR